MEAFHLVGGVDGEFAVLDVLLQGEVHLGGLPPRGVLEEILGSVSMITTAVSQISPGFLKRRPE